MLFRVGASEGVVCSPSACKGGQAHTAHTCPRPLWLLGCRGGGAARAEQNAVITQLYNKTAEVKVGGTGCDLLWHHSTCCVKKQA